MRKLCVRSDDIPYGFEPLDKLVSDNSDFHLDNGDIFCFFANLFDNTSQIDSLKRLLCPLNGTWTEHQEFVDAKLLELFPPDFANVLSIIIENTFAEDNIDENTKGEEAFSSIDAAIGIAHKVAENLTAPDFVTPSGMTNREVLANTLSMMIEQVCVFDVRYYPIFGFCDGKPKFIDAYLIGDAVSAIFFSELQILRDRINISICLNCGKYFVPRSKSNEKYCDSVYMNGKTCKELGYENRVKNDEILREYRKIYKTQNARKQRNSHIKDIGKRFDSWKIFAKKKLEECKIGKISIDCMKSSISGNEWMEGNK